MDASHYRDYENRRQKQIDKPKTGGVVDESDMEVDATKVRNSNMASEKFT